MNTLAVTSYQIKDFKTGSSRNSITPSIQMRYCATRDSSNKLITGKVGFVENGYVYRVFLRFMG
jgi:hypothetical protein